MAKAPQADKNFNALMEKCRTFLDQHPQEQDEVALGILMNSLAGRDAGEAMNVMSMLLAQFCMATSDTFDCDVCSVLLGVMTDAAEQINVMEGAEGDEEDYEEYSADFPPPTEAEEAEMALQEYQATRPRKGMIH